LVATFVPAPPAPDEGRADGRLWRPGPQARAGGQGDGACIPEHAAPAGGFLAGHGSQHDDVLRLNATGDERRVREAQAEATERQGEPLGAAHGALGPQLGRECAARHHPAHPGQPERKHTGDGLEGRPPRLSGEDRDVVGVEAAVQEGPRRRLGPARRVEERDEQDLGRTGEGAHDSPTATKK
jgi:hypothetical protein